MRRRLVRVASVVAVALILAACGDASPADDDPERCDVPFTVPAGFEVTGGIEDPYDDRIGVRIDLEGDGRRELHFFVGIPGEFGEGLPDEGSLPMTAGGEGSLLGRDDVWAFVAGTGGGCADTAVLGSGLDRGEFVDVLREVGAVSA
jgi:hypothetical protein